jgi:hypothetical protein
MAQLMESTAKGEHYRKKGARLTEDVADPRRIRSKSKLKRAGKLFWRTSRSSKNY